MHSQNIRCTLQTLSKTLVNSFSAVSEHFWVLFSVPVAFWRALLEYNTNNTEYGQKKRLFSDPDVSAQRRAREWLSLLSTPLVGWAGTCPAPCGLGRRANSSHAALRRCLLVLLDESCKCAKSRLRSCSYSRERIDQSFQLFFLRRTTKKSRFPTEFCFLFFCEFLNFFF